MVGFFGLSPNNHSFKFIYFEAILLFLTLVGFNVLTQSIKNNCFNSDFFGPDVVLLNSPPII